MERWGLGGSSCQFYPIIVTEDYSSHSSARQMPGLDAYWKVRSIHLSQPKLCTRKTELALEMKFRLDFYRVTWP